MDEPIEIAHGAESYAAGDAILRFRIDEKGTALRIGKRPTSGLVGGPPVAGTAGR